MDRISRAGASDPVGDHCSPGDDEAGAGRGGVSKVLLLAHERRHKAREINEVSRIMIANSRGRKCSQ